MLELYKGIEPNIFNLLIISFLYVFQKKFQNIYIENGLLYLFSFIQIFASAISDILNIDMLKNICFIICGISCFFWVWLFTECIFKASELKKTGFKKAVGVILGAIFGVIAFYLLKYSRINAVSFLMALGVLILFALEQYNKIRIDNLTRLYNRYGMDVELKKQLHQYKKDKEDSFYLIACDLDNFKHINDTWGHLEGDRALKLVAGALGKVGKSFSAGVFRIGGDEFVIITDKSPKGLDSEIVKAVEAEMDKLEFRDDFDIKMSIGTALYNGITPIDELLNNADKKLYEAKRAGKTYAKEKACV